MIGIVRGFHDYRKKHRLSARLLAYILVISSLLTLLGTGLQVYNDYRNDVSQIHADIRTIEESFLQPLANSVWNLDLEQVKVQLQGALKLRDMIHAEVREIRKGDSILLVEQGHYDATSSITETFTLIYNSSSFSAKVGELQATFSLKGVYARLQEKVVLILITQFIKTFIVSLCILAIIHLLITRHLTQLSNLASNIDFSDLSKHWKLNRAHHGDDEKDELDRLVDSFNTMQSDLHQHLEKRSEAEAALRKHREQLEAEVSRRTQELVENMARLEQEVKIRVASEQRADHANRAKSQFLANMSHEIRTPMNAVLGFAQILAESEQDPEKARYLASIKSSGKTLLYLINDILDLSKIEAGKLELELGPVSMTRSLQELEAMFSNQLESSGLELRVQAQTGFPSTLLLDEQRVRQILTNLISNAVKFTRQGYIHIKAEYQLAESDKNHVNLTLSVADTGIGIPDNQLSHIFGAFQQRNGQDSAQYGGTGLGLAITQRLVQVMGGKIDVTSELEQGSTFSVHIPKVPVLSSTTVRPPADRSDVFDRLHFNPARVLICDDVAINRELLRDFLSPWKFEILTAINGQEAVQLARHEHPDLILMDMKMPVMDGFTTCKELKSDPELAAVPILVVTASATASEESEIKEYCEGFLHKPISRGDLISECMRFLPHHHLLSTSKNNSGEKASFSADTLATPPTLLPLLRKNLSPARELARKMIIQDIEAFATQLIVLAAEQENLALELWCQQLETAAADFDSHQISGLLQLYIDVVEECQVESPGNGADKGRQSALRRSNHADNPRGC